MSKKIIGKDVVFLIVIVVAVIIVLKILKWALMNLFVIVIVAGIVYLLFRMGVFGKSKKE